MSTRPRSTSTLLIAGALVSLALAVPAAAVAGDLAGARALYASAAYEEALSSLATIGAGESTEVVEQLRALCFLGLGRTDDAERSLERIVFANPTYSVSRADVSPRLVRMFEDVRRRALPGAIRELYEKGKSEYEAKQFAAAAASFKLLLTLLDDDAAIASDSSLRDLGQLGEGFLQLSEAEASRAAPVVPASPAARGAVAVSAPAATLPQPLAAPPPLYSSRDGQVVPPAEISRRMPPWVPISRLLREGTFKGVLEIVISETGEVEKAEVTTSVAPGYDGPLLAAAREWRFTPATLEGKPVKYLKVMEIVLSPGRE